MKKIYGILLMFIAVFCLFTGCADKVTDDKTDNSTNTNITTEEAENGRNTNENNNDGPTYEIVSPITDGGSYAI